MVRKGSTVRVRQRALSKRAANRRFLRCRGPSFRPSWRRAGGPMETIWKHRSSRRSSASRLVHLGRQAPACPPTQRISGAGARVKGSRRPAEGRRVAVSLDAECRWSYPDAAPSSGSASYVASRTSWVRCIWNRCGPPDGGGAPALQRHSRPGRRSRWSLRLRLVCLWCAHGDDWSRTPGEAGLISPSAEAAGGVKRSPSGPSAASCEAVLLTPAGVRASCCQPRSIALSRCISELRGVTFALARLRWVASLACSLLRAWDRRPSSALTAEILRLRRLRSWCWIGSRRSRLVEHRRLTTVCVRPWAPSESQHSKLLERHPGVRGPGSGRRSTKSESGPSCADSGLRRSGSESRRRSSLRLV